MGIVKEHYLNLQEDARLEAEWHESEERRMLLDEAYFCLEHYAKRLEDRLTAGIKDNETKWKKREVGFLESVIDRLEDGRHLTDAQQRWFGKRTNPMFIGISRAPARRRQIS